MITLTRILAVVSKEAIEALRQPRMLVVIVLGPFLILLIFGLGLREHDPELRTLFVVPDDPELAEQVREFADTQDHRLIVEDIVNDEEAALRRLRSGAVQLVVAFPADVEETVRADEQAVMTLYHAQMDPVEAQAIALYMQAAVSEVNELLLANVVGEGQAEGADFQERVQTARQQLQDVRDAVEADDEEGAEQALTGLRAETAALALAAGPLAGTLGEDSGPARAQTLNERVAEIEDPDEMAAEADELDQDLADLEEALETLQSVSPEVAVAPFRGETVQVPDEGVEFSDFYAPAVVVVLLQHLLITLGGLALVREHTLGTSELYRVAPLRVSELVIGKHIAYAIMGAIVAGVLVAALVLGLGVPMRGDPLHLIAVIAAVLLASAGLGFCVAGVSSTDSQAVQATMLILLATIFLSGFVLSLDRFIPQFGWISWLLPPTYGIELMRQVMLRGVPPDWTLLAILVAFGLGLAIVGGIAARWRLNRA